MTYRQEAERVLAQWRELERELETADDDGREDLQARIRELRDRYQVLIADVEGHWLEPSRIAEPGAEPSGC